MKIDYNKKSISELKKLGIKMAEIEMAESTLNDFKKFAKSMDEFKNRWKKVSDLINSTLNLVKDRNPIFIENDWYLSESVFRDSRFLIEKMELDNHLVELFELNLEKIKKRLIDNHKNRSEIITELFRTFNDEYYCSTILLSYTTIDGISREKFNMNFWKYDIKQKKTNAQKLSDQVESDGVFEIIKKSLKYRGEFSLPESAIPMEERHYSFNRHCVVHGESFLYGTRVNAVRAIYLLDFVSSLRYNE